MANKIVVTGARGQLGSCLVPLAKLYPEYEFIFTDIDELNVTDPEAVAAFFEANRPRWVVNAAAYTAVDKAETETEQARLLNATAVGILARQSAAVGAGFVHVSTDYVFDGQSPVLLTEDMATNPRSVYGVTKLEGEKLALEGNSRTIILRTSWLYSVYGSNFVKTMRHIGAEKSEVSVVADQWGSPTSADDLAIAIMTAITKTEKDSDLYGVYHFSNQGTTCWADFAQQIMDLSGLDCTVVHITTAEYPRTAARPEYAMLSSEKFQRAFDVQIPEWEHSLEEMIKKL